VTKFGGKISFFSEENVGSIFKFSFEIEEIEVDA
jgi:hypothetical protein